MIIAQTKSKTVNDGVEYDVIITLAIEINNTKNKHQLTNILALVLFLFFIKRHSTSLIFQRFQYLFWSNLSSTQLVAFLVLVSLFVLFSKECLNLCLNNYAQEHYAYRSS